MQLVKEQLFLFLLMHSHIIELLVFKELILHVLSLTKNWYSYSQILTEQGTMSTQHSKEIFLLSFLVIIKQPTTSKRKHSSLDMIICFTQFSKNRINGTHWRESNKKDATKQKANIVRKLIKDARFQVLTFGWQQLLTKLLWNNRGKILTSRRLWQLGMTAEKEENWNRLLSNSTDFSKTRKHIFS